MQTVTRTSLIDEIKSKNMAAITPPLAAEIIRTICEVIVKTVARDKYKKFVAEVKKKSDTFEYTIEDGHKVITGDIQISDYSYSMVCDLASDIEKQAYLLYKSHPELFKDFEKMNNVREFSLYDNSYTTTCIVKLNLCNYTRTVKKGFLRKDSLYNFFATEWGKLMYDEFLQIAEGDGAEFELKGMIGMGYSPKAPKKIPSEELAKKCKSDKYNSGSFTLHIAYRLIIE